MDHMFAGAIFLDLSPLLQDCLWVLTFWSPHSLATITLLEGA